MATRLKKRSPRKSARGRAVPEGWSGWDEYARFYDWENAQTLGREDVRFWRRLAGPAHGRVLELGCGTGRLSLPLARSGAELVGIDRSGPMITVAARRARALRRRTPRSALCLVRGDIRALPFAAERFQIVLAPYGVLQSLTAEADLVAALRSVARVLQPGGLFGIDLVPDVPRWQEYQNRVQLRGRSRGGYLTLVESVRQDRRKRLTTFTQRYRERRGRTSTERTFDLTFRTLSVPEMAKRLEQSGFQIEALVGDYDGGPWNSQADAWIILARRRARRRAALATPL